MSRRDDRAERRRVRFEQQVEEFTRLRHDPEGFQVFLTRLAAGPMSVWDVAEESARTWPLDECELAMIRRAVAPHLAAMTPGCVRKRYESAKA